MDFPNIALTGTPDATERAGAVLAESLERDPALPRFVALYGDLGAGKTAFARGFIRYFFPRAAVKSPTFALVNEYGQAKKIRHFDMYRIEGEDELYSTGFYDFLDEPQTILIAEWCEKIPFALPENLIRVQIEKPDRECPDLRKITIEKLVNHENSCR